MTKQYIAFFERDPEVKGFGVIFPDLPGCFSQGNTYENAVRRAHEALSLYADGEKIPEPRTLEEIQETWKDWKDWKSKYNFTVEHIALLPLNGKKERFNVTLDAGLVARIDRVTKNRSAFLAEAAQRLLEA